MRLPNRWVRRFLIWPLPVIVVVLYLATVPLLIVGALVISYRLPGKLRALRTLGLATVYLIVEAAALIVGAVLWVASGFGWKLKSPAFIAAHYAVLRLALRVLVAFGRRLFSLDIRADGAPIPADDHDPNTVEVPLIVMSRHAGPADSFLLLHEVMSWRGRRPRIVAKDLLQLDPTIDLYLNRLPNKFITQNPGRRSGTVEAIGELAEGMTHLDALVIFPEGGNFTPDRRLRAIDRLREGGYEAAAERAERLHNVLPPRPAGSRAAMAGAPQADVVFVAHTGLDTIATIQDLWFAIPTNKVIDLAWDVVEADVIPRDKAGQEDMLFRAWEAIDEWVEERRVAPQQPS